MAEPKLGAGTKLALGAIGLLAILGVGAAVILFVGGGSNHEKPGQGGVVQGLSVTPTRRAGGADTGQTGAPTRTAGGGIEVFPTVLEATRAPAGAPTAPVATGTEVATPMSVSTLAPIPITTLPPSPQPAPVTLPPAPPTLPPPPPPTEVPYQVVVESCIEGTFTGWTGNTLFELCNGQLWMQASYDYVYHYAYRPDVVIVLYQGSYLMIVDGVDDLIVVKQVTDFQKTCIDGTFEGWTGDTVFELCNGQVWQQAEYSYWYHYAYRPDVLIYWDGYEYRMRVDDEDKTIAVVRLY